MQSAADRPQQQQQPSPTPAQPQPPSSPERRPSPFRVRTAVRSGENNSNRLFDSQ